jgi:hypothetical protein
MRLISWIRPRGSETADETSEECLTSIHDNIARFLNYYWSVRHDLAVVINTENAYFTGVIDTGNA